MYTRWTAASRTVHSDFGRGTSAEGRDRHMSATRPAVATRANRVSASRSLGSIVVSSYQGSHLAWTPASRPSVASLWRGRWRGYAASGGRFGQPVPWWGG